jgi:hypothetical protein
MKSDNEMMRVGAAGSLTMLVGESSFYCIDAINARSKMLEANVGFREMMQKIIKNEGYCGMFKGFSATYYSSILSGFIYFYLYKGLKVTLKEKYEPETPSQNAAIYATASTIAEIATLTLYYPYEMIKVRLMTKNDVYKYDNLMDAFRKIILKDKIPGLYRGLFSFFITYMG